MTETPLFPCMKSDASNLPHIDDVFVARNSRALVKCTALNYFPLFATSDESYHKYHIIIWLYDIHHNIRNRKTNKMTNSFLSMKFISKNHSEANNAEIENGADEQPPTPIQKKTSKKSSDRWTHDFYDESEQAPKSRAELVNSYGYDIRNEDGPPKTRRNRRYKYVPSLHSISLLLLYFLWSI